MKSNIKKKKRSKAEKSLWIKRSISLIILLVLLFYLILFLINLFKWTKDYFFKKNPNFEIQHIYYESNGGLSENFIREQLAHIGVTNGANIFSFDFNDIEEIILSLSYVKNVSIKRDLPNALRIKLYERKGVATLDRTTRKGIMLEIDEDSFVFNAGLESHRLLPQIVGYKGLINSNNQIYDKDINLALDIISICDENDYLSKHLQISRIDIRNNDFILLRLFDGIQIKLPRVLIKKKLQDVCSTMVISKGRGQSVRIIDAVGSNIIIRK